jgi:hypothetical protein
VEPITGPPLKPTQPGDSRSVAGLDAIPAVPAMAWVSFWLDAPALFLLLFVILLFPNGQLPSRRWRPVAWLLAIAAAAGAGVALRPGELPELAPIRNPFGGPGRHHGPGAAGSWFPVPLCRGRRHLGGVVAATAPARPRPGAQPAQVVRLRRGAGGGVPGMAHGPPHLRSTVRGGMPGGARRTECRPETGVPAAAWRRSLPRLSGGGIGSAPKAWRPQAPPRWSTAGPRGSAPASP